MANYLGQSNIVVLRGLKIIKVVDWSYTWNVKPLSDFVPQMMHREWSRVWELIVRETRKISTLLGPKMYLESVWIYFGKY